MLYGKSYSHLPEDDQHFTAVADAAFLGGLRKNFYDRGKDLVDSFATFWTKTVEGKIVTMEK
jgi:hypothetical protein